MLRYCARERIDNSQKRWWVRFLEIIRCAPYIIACVGVQFSVYAFSKFYLDACSAMQLFDDTLSTPYGLSEIALMLDVMHWRKANICSSDRGWDGIMLSHCCATLPNEEATPSVLNERPPSSAAQRRPFRVSRGSSTTVLCLPAVPVNPSQVPSISFSPCWMLVTLADEFRSRNFSIYAQWLGVVSIIRIWLVLHGSYSSLYCTGDRQYIPCLSPDHLLYHLPVQLSRVLEFW